MFFKSFQKYTLALAFSILSISLSSELFASHSESSSKHPIERNQFIKPAQVFLQDETPIPLVNNETIPFASANFVENIKLKNDNSVVKILVPGKYDLGAEVIINDAVVGEFYDLVLLINGKSFLVFDQPVEAFLPTATLFAGTTIYLKKGDEVAFAFRNSSTATLGRRTASVIIASNTRENS